MLFYFNSSFLTCRDACEIRTAALIPVFTAQTHLKWCEIAASKVFRPGQVSQQESHREPEL